MFCDYLWIAMKTIKGALNDYNPHWWHNITDSPARKWVALPVCAVTYIRDSILLFPQIYYNCSSPEGISNATGILINIWFGTFVGHIYFHRPNFKNAQYEFVTKCQIVIQYITCQMKHVRLKNSNLHFQFIHSSLIRSLHFHDSSYRVVSANLHLMLFLY